MGNEGNPASLVLGGPVLGLDDLPPMCTQTDVVNPCQDGGQVRRMHLFFILPNEDILLVWNFLDSLLFSRISWAFSPSR